MAKFSREHYTYLSSHLRDIKSHQYRNDIAEWLVDVLVSDNKMFDPNRFYHDSDLEIYRAEEKIRIMHY